MPSVSTHTPTGSPFSNWKVVRLMKSMSANEMEELDKFISINIKSKTLLRLFGYLQRNINNEANLNLSAVHKYVYDKPLSNLITARDKLKRRSSELVKKVEHFCIELVANRQEEQFYKHYLYLKYLQENYLIDDFITQYKKTLALLKKGKDADIYYQEFLFEKLLNKLISSLDPRSLEHWFNKHKAFFEHFFAIKSAEKTNDEIRHISFNRTSAALDHFYLSQKSVYCCQLINSNKVKKVDALQMIVPQPVINYLDYLQANTKDEQSLKIWNEALHFLMNPHGEAQYDRIVNLLKNEHNLLTRNDVRNLFAYVQNNITAVFEPQSTEYYNRLFECYRFQDEHGIFDDHNFTASIMKNVVKVAVVKQELDWLHQFLVGKEEAGQKFNDGSYEFCMAEYHFARNEYNKALELLLSIEKNVSKNRIANGIALRILKLKIYYELNLNHEFSINHNNFSSFLSAHKHQIHEAYLEQNRGFLQKVKDLFDNYIASSRKYKRRAEKINDLKSFQIEIMDGQSQVVEKNWLLKKVASLLKSNSN